MAIYLKLDKIDGPVTTKGFEKTIELLTFSGGADRHMNQPSRSEKNRGHAEAEVPMINVSKMWDGVSSAKIFESVLKGDMDMTGTISFTNADSPPVAYLEIELKNVGISSYILSGSNASAVTEVPNEQMFLSFTDIQITPFTIGSDKKANKGSMVKHSLTSGETS
jgi:type VI secretion system secreted protein Hcp